MPDAYFTSQDTALAWEALLGAARVGRRMSRQTQLAFRVDSTGALQPSVDGAPGAALLWHPDSGWSTGSSASPALRELAGLYMPLVTATSAKPLVVGHLGQSLDGFIATASGDSYYVNGPLNMLHLHRMRALCDAVVVGAGTVATDNPRLTTRLVSGDTPRRVVLDPYGRLPLDRKVFSDRAAPTLVVRASDAADASAHRFGEAEIVSVPAHDGRLDLRGLLEKLRIRGLTAVFVEGGGATVSAFLQAGLLDRLQVTVAPLIIGNGRPGIQFPGCEKLRDCPRPLCHLHRLGDEVLFDCELRAKPLAAGVPRDGDS